MRMTPERLAEIREWQKRTFETPGSEQWMIADDHVTELLAEIDRLTARHAAARRDWVTMIKFRTTQREVARAEVNRLRRELG